jgi:hypothetical protein
MYLKLLRWQIVGVALMATTGVAQAAIFDNGGFEANSFSETPGLQDVDSSPSPGNIDSWQYTSAVSPMAALFRGGSIYAPRSGDYMLGLGSTPSGFPNSALTGQAETTVTTGLAVNQTYEWTFWYAPGYVIDTSSGSNQYLFGSDLGATTTAQIQASVIDGMNEVGNTFVSSVPTAQQTPSPLGVDWQQASLTFVAPATELTFSLAVVPDSSTNAGALVGYYFIDDNSLQVVPEPSSAMLGLCAVMFLVCRVTRRR